MYGIYHFICQNHHFLRGFVFQKRPHPEVVEVLVKEKLGFVTAGEPKTTSGPKMFPVDSPYGCFLK